MSRPATRPTRYQAMQAEIAAGRKPWWSGQEGCDCSDCDGTWCVWCFVHHGKRPCPVEEECKAAEAEEAERLRLLPRRPPIGRPGPRHRSREAS